MKGGERRRVMKMTSRVDHIDTLAVEEKPENGKEPINKMGAKFRKKWKLDLSEELFIF